MKVLVIPDVHLKPWMFERASELMSSGIAEQAVCLMDIPDDWNQQFNMELYEKTFDSAIAFAGEYPDSLWCYGNHDVSYLWNRMESGFSPMMKPIVCGKHQVLRNALNDPEQLSFVHRIDGALFSHGGLSEAYVRSLVPDEILGDDDRVIEAVNGFDAYDLWDDLSPLWFRPQYGGRLYGSGRLLQVAGHTPVERLERKGDLISCDVFSTHRHGTPIGTREFLLLDTKTREFEGVK